MLEQLSIFHCRQRKDQPDCGGERPTAPQDKPQENGEQQEDNEGALAQHAYPDGTGSVTPPNRRSRRANSQSAVRSSSGPKSGQKVRVTYHSA